MNSMTPAPGKPRNVILDLGGVLYAIDSGRTIAAFQALAGKNARPLSPDAYPFPELEMGILAPDAFRASIRQQLDTEATDQELDAAWNALLLGPIPNRAQWVEALARRFRVVLLSNTNVIHRDVWMPQCEELFSRMEATWFSYDLGMRKPDQGIYAHVLQAMDMRAEETLFLDDNVQNLAGAATLGIQVGWIDPENPAQFEAYCRELMSKD